MKRSINEQIRRNRLGSLLVTLFMVLLLSALGAGFAAPFRTSSWWIGAAVGSFVALTVGVIGWWRGTKMILESTKAQPATGESHRQFQNTVEEVATAAGMMPPRCYVMELGAPNAFATYLPDGSAAIVATRSLLTELDRDELQAVVAHEVAHIRNGDVRFMTMVVFIAGIVPLLCHVLIEGLSSFDVDDFMTIVVMVAALVVLGALSPLFTLVLRVAISRKREYLADASAVELTRNPEALCSALSKLGSTRQTRFASGATATRHMYIVDPSGQGPDGHRTFFSTHPLIPDRIRAIRELMGTDPAPL